jgi:hypothetical protein
MSLFPSTRLGCKCLQALLFQQRLTYGQKGLIVQVTAFIEQPPHFLFLSSILILFICGCLFRLHQNFFSFFLSLCGQHFTLKITRPTWLNGRSHETQIKLNSVSLFVFLIDREWNERESGQATLANSFWLNSIFSSLETENFFSF